MTAQRDLFRSDAVAAPRPAPRHDFTFFLGTHHAAWLGKTDVPLFVSRRSLQGRRTLPRARGRWALDSAAFTELSLHGRWTLTAEAYVDLVRRFAIEIGNLEWAAVQDLMCEEEILRRTGLTVADHQRLTVQSFIELKSAAPEIPWAPVLQGWTRGDYLEHIDEYARAGVDLTAQPIVGVGSICRRQHTLRASILLHELNDLGLKLHAFGFKVNGLTGAHEALVSSDSLAWSLQARKGRPLDECEHAKCSNCIRFALDWRERLLSRLDR